MEISHSKIDQIHQQAFFVLILLFLIALPCTAPFFFNITPLLTALLIVNELIFWLFNIKTKNISNAYKGITTKMVLKKTLPFLFFYLIYLYGILISDKHLFDDLVQKLPFLIIPLVFAIQQPHVFSKQKIQILIWTFAVSCVVSFFILIGHAFILEEHHIDPYHYYYSNLSWRFHPTYISMIYLVAIMLLIFNCIKNNWNIKLQILTIFVSIILFIGILLLFSRSSILATILTFFVYFVYLLFRTPKKALQLIKLLLIPILGCGICLYIMPQNNNRFIYTQKVLKQEVKNAQMYDSYIDGQNKHVPKYKEARMQTWYIYYMLGKQAFPKGVGIVNLNEKGTELALELGYTKVSDKQLNAHNQYLEIFAGMGLLGVLIFGFFIVELIYNGFKYKNIQFLLFLLICLFSFCFEAILERQVGIMFFVFFSSFLQIPYFLSEKKQLS